MGTLTGGIVFVASWLRHSSFIWIEVHFGVRLFEAEKATGCVDSVHQVCVASVQASVRSCITEHWVRCIQTCNPAHFFRRNAFTSETSDLSAQAVAYNVEILQFGTCLRHEELYQFRYVSSRWRCVQHSGYVVRFCGEQ